MNRGVLGGQDHFAAGAVAQPLPGTSAKSPFLASTTPAKELADALRSISRPGLTMALHVFFFRDITACVRLAISLAATGAPVRRSPERYKKGKIPQ